MFYKKMYAEKRPQRQRDIMESYRIWGALDDLQSEEIKKASPVVGLTVGTVSAFC